MYSGAKILGQKRKQAQQAAAIAKIAGETSRIMRYGPSKGSIPRSLRGYARFGGYYGRYNFKKRQGPGERKFLDTTIAFNALTAGSIPNTSLNVIPQDITESGRIGRKVVIRSVQFNIRWNPNSTVENDNVRFMLVQDKQCNGATAIVSGNGGVLETASVTSYRNLESIDRYNVLYDNVFFFAARAVLAGPTYYSNDIPMKSFYKRCYIPIEYDASVTTGALTSIRSNNLFLLCVATDNNNVIGVNGVCRIRYTDI